MSAGLRHQTIGNWLASPDHRVEVDEVGEQILAGSDRDPLSSHVNVAYVSGGRTARKAKALALADRDELDRINVADLIAIGVDDLCWGVGKPIAQEFISTCCAADETNVLAIGFVGDSHTHVGSHLANH